MAKTFVVDKDLFPATHAIQNKLTRIAKHFKAAPEDLLQDSMLLELELRSRPEVVKAAGYLILATVNRQLKACKKTSKTISIEDVDVDSSFLAVHLHRPLFLKLCLDEATEAIKKTDVLLADILTERRNSDSWADVHKNLYPNRSRSWFYEKADEVSKLVSVILANYGEV